MGTLTGFECERCGAKGACATLSCGRCGTFNSLRAAEFDLPVRPETIVPVRESAVQTAPSRYQSEFAEDDGEELTSLASVDPIDFERFSSGMWSLDRVLCGGLAFKSTIVITGDKGAGKTTISTRAVMEHVLADKNHRAVVASAEEPFERFRHRLVRLGFTGDKCERAIKRIMVTRETDIVSLHQKIEKIEPTLILYDSLRKFTHPDVDAPSFLVQGPAALNEIAEFAQVMDCCSLVVARVTKTGKTAGSVDLDFDADAILRLTRHAPKGRKTKFVKLSCEKNRLGAEEVIGWFRKTERGLLCSRGPKKRSGRPETASE